MRLFEIITIVMLLLALGRYLVPANIRPMWTLYLPGVTAVTAVVQFLVESYRWQMVPTYALTCVLLALAVPKIMRKSLTTTRVGRGRRILGVTGIVFGFLFWIVSAALPWAFPIFKLPTPTGPIAVGTHSFEWIDATRADPLTTEPGEKRDLAVRVWYPAEVTAASKPMAYWPDAPQVWSAVAKAGGFPPLLLDHLALVSTHSYPDAPLAAAQATYPIVVFSHGIWAIATQNTAQMEELASHGYIVFSIAHTYESMATQYPNGRIVPWSNERRIKFGELGRATFKAAIKPYTQTTDPLLREQLLREAFKLQHMAAATVDVWTADTRFVLDQIAKLNSGEIPGTLSGKLDLERIGLFGHSFGGSTTGQTCSIDKRCKAGINLDGMQWGNLLDESITQPFMIMHSDDPARARAESSINDFIYSRGSNTHYRALVKGSRHGDYTDFVLASPLFKSFGVMGSINANRMEVITNRYVLAFFDRYLKDIDSPLLNGPSPDFPEVEFQFWNR